jgi:uncharacterized protein YycO
VARKKLTYRIVILSFLTIALFSGYLVKSFPGIYDSRLTTPVFYLDADEIYRHYFSRFHYSTVAREQVITELKMIVNALALEKARGRDVTTTLFIMDAIVRKKMDSAALFAEFSRFDVYLQPYTARESAKQRMLARHPGVLKPSAFDARHRPFAAFIRSQSNLVEKYDLPYRIPDSTIQVMDIRGNRFLKMDPPSDPETDSDNVRRQSMMAQLDRFDWKDADILLGHSRQARDCFSIQGYWNHTGLYDSDCDCIIDSWPAGNSGPGGVVHSDKSVWAEHFDEIAVLRLGDIPLKIRKTIKRHAAARIGEPYNLTTHKMNPAGGWYCSKLIYHAYLQEGFDLDSNGGVAVMPDDIAISQGLDALVYLSGK